MMNSMDVKKLIEKGDEFFEKEKYEDAWKFYKKSTEKDLKCAEAWHKMGIVLYRLGRYNDALKAFEKVATINPLSTGAQYGKGVILFNLERYEDALEAYERTIRINPEYADAWYNKGDVLRRLERYEDALEAYEKAIEKNPEDTGARICKGYVLCRLGRYKNAFDIFEEVIKMDPENVVALNNKGYVLYTLKESGNAQKAYAKAIKISPKYISPHVNLGELLLAHGDIAQASNCVEKALEIAREKNEENAHAFLLKGKIEIERENYNCAIEFFGKSAEGYLGSALPLLWTAYARYLKAESYYSPKGNRYKGEIFKIIRELEKANDLCNEFTERKLRECILYFLGYFYCKNNDIFTAKEKLGECIKLESRWEKFKEFIGSGSRKEKFFRFISSKSKIKKLWRFITTSKSPTEQRARELLDHIWKYKINPPWWNWWLSSPLNHWLKRTTFVLLLSPIFSLLLRSLIPEYVYVPPTKGDLSVCETIVSLFFKYIPSIDKENLSVYATIIVFFLLFLLLPRVEKIKAKEVEVELGSPPSFELFLSPSMIPETLGEFSHQYMLYFELELEA
ncbi:MAG: hypothetical protein AYK18_17855 [Theionarchaea archaeon DG-70]|nr:MAG: hypothetical protein AYK18_17855 [Theionarchaea archaeon DG-70]